MRDATAFSDEGLIVVYSANATKRISTHDLEETIFHESVHAAWDKQHADSIEWRAAQTSDGVFITEYAQEHPNGEDLAESALFAYTLTHHPDRIPEDEARKIRAAIPARIEYVSQLVPVGEPIFYSIGPVAQRDENDVDRETTELEADNHNGCTVDLSNPGEMKDIISNALMLGLRVDEEAVSSFLDGAEIRFTSSDDLVMATVDHFGIDEETMRAQIQSYLHCNCDHGDLIELPVEHAPDPESQTNARQIETEGLAVTSPRTNQAEFGEVASSVQAGIRLITWLLMSILVVNTVTFVMLLRRGNSQSKS